MDFGSGASYDARTPAERGKMGSAFDACGHFVGAFADPVAVRTRLRRVAALDAPGERRALWVVDVVALALLYYGSGKLGLVLEFSGPVAAVVWLPAGVGIAYLALRGLPCWPGALLGDLIVNNYSTVAVAGGIGQTLGNVLEVVLGAWLIRRWTRQRPLLESVGGVVRTLAAIAAGTGVSALVGPYSLILANRLAWDDAPNVVRTWWLGDATGALVVVPLALAWFGREAASQLRGRSVAPAVVAVVVASSWLALHRQSPLTYVAFPALVLAAILLGPRGATLAVAIVAAFAVFQTTRYAGPFAYEKITNAVLETQLFIAVAAVSGLLVAALVSERESMLERLEIALADTVRAGYTERRRLERNLHDGAQQRLLALRLHVQALTGLVEGEPARAALVDLQRELTIALAEVRALAHGTFPPILLERGLAGAVADLAERSPLRIASLELPVGRADVPSEAMAYFVTAEALANAVKHSDATCLRIAVTTTDAEIRVEVADDGCGGAQERPGSGLAGLRERVEALGGAFDVVSPPGAGTTVTATVPTGS
jgi:signal transduction histidine kinase